MLEINYTKENEEPVTLVKLKGGGDVGGKNRSLYKGMYYIKGDEKKKPIYFIKKPGDKRELFAELLAGRLIEKFKQQGFIDETLHEGLVCADIIRLDDGQYGLIQPFVNYKEFYKISNTGKANGSDRSPFYEILYGQESYHNAINKTATKGLSSLLFLSLLFGDHSVHSANVVCLDTMDGLGWLIERLFGRIDWGAAFRYFCHPNNGVFQPYEYAGLSAFKYFTKNYISYYRKIPGLMAQLGRTARLLQHQLNKDYFIKTITEVLSELPQDLLSDDEKKQVASYFGLEPAIFDGVIFGQEHEAGKFEDAMADTLCSRLRDLEKLHPDFDFELAQNNNKNWLAYFLHSQKVIESWLKLRESFQVDDSYLISVKIPKRLIALFKKWQKIEQAGATQLALIKTSANFIPTGKEQAVAIQWSQLIDFQQTLTNYFQSKFQILCAQDSLDRAQLSKVTTLYCHLQQIEGSKAQLLTALGRVNDKDSPEYQVIVTLCERDLMSPELMEKINASKDCAKAVAVLLRCDYETMPLILAELVNYPKIVNHLVSYYERPDNKPTLGPIIQLIQYKNQMIQNNKGDRYNQQVLNFYQDAVCICLTEREPVRQKLRIEQAASYHFEHRDLVLRLMTDMLLTAGCFVGVGLIIGLVRVATGHTFYISCDKTARQIELEKTTICSWASGG